MFFNVQDVEQFLTQKEFIDTAIVPLITLDFSNEKIKLSSSSTEFLMSLTAFIEQQFKGRLMMLPPLTFMADTKNAQTIVSFDSQLKLAGFKHVFFMTCDAEWAHLKERYNMIWLPSIPLESMNSSVKKTILEDQLRQIIPLFTEKWSQVLS